VPQSQDTCSQKRRWLSTRFIFGPSQLDYSVISKNEASLQETAGYDAIGPRASYARTVDPDRELRWSLFVFSGLALFAAFRASEYQWLVLGLYAAVTLVAVLGLLLTRKLRNVSYTVIPTGTFNILVLDGDQHDEIVAKLEKRRAEALTRHLDSTEGVTLRTYLKRLRWLFENGVMMPEAFLQRQHALLPDEKRSLLLEDPAPGPVTTFTQRRAGVRIDITLEPTHFVYDRWTLLNGSERFRMDYRNLQQAVAHEETERQVELTGILLAWAGAIVLAWGGWIQQGHPANYYVGNVGLIRAITDFGPMLLFALGAAAVIPWLMQIKVARPWPGIVLIRDKQYGAIVAAIEERRVAALRMLAKFDPLLHPQEQGQILDELHAAGLLSDAEHAQAIKQAETAFNDPVLDEPVAGDEANSGTRILH
jgi:hypothetical protein